MRRLTYRLLVAVAVLSWAQASAAQTADEVIEKSIAAMGGRAAFDKIKSRTLAGSISIGTPAGDLPGTIEILNAVPNKARTLIKADLSAFGAGQMVIDQRFDGSVGYVLDTMQGDRPMTAGQLESVKNNSFPRPFLNYKAMGSAVKLGEKSKVGTRDALLLVFEPAAGSPIKQYVDAETFMPLRTTITAEVPQLGPVEQSIDASDFRDLDGIKVPFKLRLSSSVQTVDMSFSKIEQNVVVDEKLFSKPQ